MTDEEKNQQELEAQEMTEKQCFAGEVWQTLSKINVNELTETKGGKVKLTYLSWMGAWSSLMELYPESSYKMLENEYFPDETMSAGMQVTVRKGGDKVKRKMWLQVLDYSNKAIPSPTSHDINNTRMRCLAKCVAMCGLGSYLYMRGHDLPLESDQKATAKTKGLKKPRIAHDKHYPNCIEAMDSAGTIEMLEFQFGGAYKHFQQWDETEYMDKLKAHYDKLKLTFEVA